MTAETMERLEVQLPVSGVVLTPVSLEIRDPNFSFESYEAVVYSASRLYTSSKFWLGDALNFGEAIFGEKYTQAADESGLSSDRLRNIAYVCRQVAVSRRKDVLRFSHHEVVAPLEPAEQIEWLDATVENGWSVAELRTRVREATPPRTPNSRPQWNRDEPPSVEPLTLEEVAEAEGRATQTLTRTLPDGHPLWRNEAESNARDVIALAHTAKPCLLDSARSLVDAATPLLREQQRGYWIPEGALLEVAALVRPKSGDLEGGKNE